MKKRILIVDDDIMTLKILKRYLEETYDVVTENAGYRFVDKMTSYEADLILMDLEMPVVNGLQAFEAVLADPEMKYVPVVFLSGVSNPNLVRELMGMGAAGYLVKTIPKGELLQRLEKIFSEGVKKQGSSEILILDSDVGHLRTMRDILTANDYKVKAVRSTMEAAEYIKNHHPALFIIGTDSAGVEPQQVYESLETEIRNERVIPLLLEENFFTAELIDRVKQAFSLEH
ncbi:MAG: response regulator [Lachnospiraceae bacterium]|nr:response regulator [Lachnospiraceae bacterium]